MIRPIRGSAISGAWSSTGSTNVGVFRNGRDWFLDNGNLKWDGCGEFPALDRCGSFGLHGDQPLIGDWDRSGKDEVGVFRNGQWVLDNGNLKWDGCGEFPTQDRCGSFGLPGDQPLIGNWDGSVKVGVFRNGQWFLDNGNLKWDGCGEFPTQDRCGSFGLPGDQPVVGDWDGSGKDEVGVFRNGQWFLDNGNLQWDGCGWLQDTCGSFGLPGDKYVVGDWSGSGRDKTGVFRNGEWFLDNGNLQWDGCGEFPSQDRCGSFGLSGDTARLATLADVSLR